MNLKVGDIVTIKPLEEIAKIATGYDEKDGSYIFEGYFDFIKEMFKYCGKQVEIKEIEEHHYSFPSFRIKEDGGANHMVGGTCHV